MTIAMQAIYTQTVGSGGVGSVSFFNIPQTFTDLKLVISARSTRTGYSEQNLFILPNTDINNVNSWTRISGNGSTTASARSSNTNFIPIGLIPAPSGTANTFSNIEVYIPNYTSSTLKPFLADAVGENNATSNTNQFLVAGVYGKTTPITQIYFTDEAGTIAQYSTFSLYGITKG